MNSRGSKAPTNTRSESSTYLALENKLSNLSVASHTSNISNTSNKSYKSNTSNASNSSQKYGLKFSINDKCKSNFYKIEIDYSKGAIHYDVEILFLYKNKNNGEKEAKAKKEFLK
jgi:hypothetical protein